MFELNRGSWRRFSEEEKNLLRYDCLSAFRILRKLYNAGSRAEMESAYEARTEGVDEMHGLFVRDFSASDRPALRLRLERHIVPVDRRSRRGPLCFGAGLYGLSLSLYVVHVIVVEVEKPYFFPLSSSPFAIISVQRSHSSKAEE